MFSDRLDERVDVIRARPAPWGIALLWAPLATSAPSVGLWLLSDIGSGPLLGVLLAPVLTLAAAVRRGTPRAAMPALAITSLSCATALAVFFFLALFADACGNACNDGLGT